MSPRAAAPLMGRIRETSNGCWEWTGNRIRGGYGQLGGGSTRTQMAHRMAYEQLVGPIPEGLELDHLCVNPPCVNPAHLEPVTHEENMRRAAARRTTCGNGHPWTPENTRIGWNGQRLCRPCRREQKRRAWQRKRSAQEVAA